MTKEKFKLNLTFGDVMDLCNDVFADDVQPVAVEFFEDDEAPSYGNMANRGGRHKRANTFIQQSTSMTMP